MDLRGALGTHGPLPASIFDETTVQKWGEVKLWHSQM